MTVPTIPNPNNAKGIVLIDVPGGAEYVIPCTIGANNAIDTGSALLVGGLGLTTAGVTDTTDKRFVTDAELANLVLLASVAAQTGADMLLTSAAAVNLNTATPPTIYTVPTGKSAVITSFVIRNASTSLTTVSFSIGYTSASYADVLADATHTELTGATLYTRLSAKAGALIGTTGQLLKLKNNTLQGGAATCTIDVFGYLF